MSGNNEHQEQPAFPLSHRKQRGYDRNQVDELLSRARSTYEGAATDDEKVTSADLRGAAFALRRRGYEVRYVDAALDRLEDVFFERERLSLLREAGDDAWWGEMRELLSEVRSRLSRPHGKRFRRRGILATGYRMSQVDAFLDSLDTAFANRHLSYTPTDVREVVFHSQWRGYDEAQVDAFLDAIVDLILATK